MRQAWRYESVCMSGESDKGRIDPNATIQLDALDGVELEDLDAPLGTERRVGVASETPPPLPAFELPPGAVSAGLVKPSDVPAAGRGVGKTIAYGAMFIALLAVAIAAGLSVGSRARFKLPFAPVAPVAPVASGPTAPSAPGAPPGSAPARTLTLPTVEIRGK
jgi:hypothetical protein